MVRGRQRSTTALATPACWRMSCNLAWVVAVHTSGFIYPGSHDTPSLARTPTPSGRLAFGHRTVAALDEEHH